jgi:peptidoglycan hydrolase-like protein with peptidoglycan-binding domain
MALQSNLFRPDQRLQRTLTLDSAHVVPGDRGDHVARIQVALQDLDGLEIYEDELAEKLYGPSTAAAVLSFKRARKIINRSYQTTEDNIVGKMTIAALDKEMLAKQELTFPRPAVRYYHRKSR